MPRRTDDFLAIEVDVLDPQLQRLRAGAARTRRAATPRERAAPLMSLEDRRDFLRRENHGDALGQLRARRSLQPFQLSPEDGAIEEQDRAEGLVLRRGRDAKARGQGREESRDLGLGHGVGMAAAAEHDEAADPEDVGLLGARRVVARTDGLAHLIQQAGLGGRNGLESGFRHDGSDGSRERPRW